MLCEKCGAAMRIQRAWYSVTGAPGVSSETVSNAEVCCVNPKCPRKGKKFIETRPVQPEKN